jgi:hypothetical protein
MLIMGEHNKFQSSTFCSNMEGVKHSRPLGYFNQSLDDSLNWHLIGFVSSASSIFKLHSSLLIFLLPDGSFMELPYLIQVPWSSIYLGCTLLSSTRIPSLQYISLKSPVKGLSRYPAL